MVDEGMDSETARIRALREYEILDTPPSREFDRLTELAVRLFRVPTALITLVDERRQWFKSRVNLTPTETPREIAFCGLTVTSNEVFVVPDAHEDPRFRNNPLVTGDPRIRFYAGAPLRTRSGFAVGSLAIIDYVPRELSEDERRALSTLAAVAMDELELWRASVRELNERRFEALIEKAHDLIVLLDRDGRMLYVSPSVTPLLGYQRDEFLRLSLDQVMHPEENARLRESLAHILRVPGRVAGSVYRQRHKDGSWRRMQAVLQNLLDEPGVRAIVVNARDVTEREESAAQLAVRALQQSVLADLGLRVLEARTFKDLLSDVMRAIRDTLEVEMVSWFSRESTGLRLEAGLGWPDLAMGQLLVPADLRPGDPVPAMTARGVLASLSVTVPAADGMNAVLAVHSKRPRTFTDDEGHFLQAVGALLGAKLREEEAKDRLRVREEELRQAHRMEAVGQLAGGIAHDFNNLLTAILNYAGFALKSLPEDHRARADIEEVAAAAARAATLTRHVLAFSRQQVLNPTELDLNLLIRELLKLLRRTLGEHIEIAFLPNDRAFPVLGDAAQLERVLINLCVNARDAMAAGGRLTIATSNASVGESQVSRHPWVRPGRFTVLTVADTGTGMLPEVRSRIFEPFFTTKEVGKGTGLGLASAYGIVRQHGGFVEVESEPGHGSSFAVYLPAAKPTSMETDARRPEPVPGGSETILLAEDDELVRRVAVRILQDAGYRVLAAGTGEEAVRIFEQHGNEVDLAVLDLVMPQLGGRGALAQMRQRRPGLKFVLCSGYARMEDDQTLTLRPDEHATFLPKPYTPQSLLRKVREALGSG